MLGTDMGWVNEAVSALNRRQRVQIRPVGASMRGRLSSGDLVTLEPVNPADVQPDDVVLVAWKGNDLLHLVKEATTDQLLIGNNIGKINGWSRGQR